MSNLIAQIHITKKEQFLEFNPKQKNLTEIIETDWYKKRAKGLLPNGEAVKVDWNLFRVKLA